MTYTFELSTLAPKIEAARRALEQESDLAARAIRDGEKETVAFCRRLIAIVKVVLDDTTTVFPVTGWRVVVMSLLVKVIATVRAAENLAEAGHAREMPIILRSALESLITALFIAKKDSRRRASRWAQHAVIIKARAMAKHEQLSLTEEQVKVGRRIQAQARRLEKTRAFPSPQFWASGLRKGSVRDLAVDVEMVWYYDAVYWSGSQSTHGSAVGLESYVDVSPVGEPVYKFGLSADHLKAELAVCCDLLARTLVLLNRLGRLGLEKLLTEVATEYKTAFGGDHSAGFGGEGCT